MYLMDIKGEDSTGSQEVLEVSVFLRPIVNSYTCINRMWVVPIKIIMRTPSKICILPFIQVQVCFFPPETVSNVSPNFRIFPSFKHPEILMKRKILSY